MNIWDRPKLTKAQLEMRQKQSKFVYAFNEFRINAMDYINSRHRSIYYTFEGDTFIAGTRDSDCGVDVDQFLKVDKVSKSRLSKKKIVEMLRDGARRC